ncbi:hypothetical protein GCM10027029_33570 [Conyzicola lurida]
MRIDEVHDHIAPGVELREVRGEPLQDADTAGPGAEHGEGERRGGGFWHAPTLPDHGGEKTKMTPRDVMTKCEAGILPAEMPPA